MAHTEIQFLGIRHHGPGSARRMLHFLENWQPDCILIESPVEAQTLFPFVNHADLKPPVAILLYEPLVLKNSLVLPFAEFSPEWIAISHANKRGITLRAFDLPAAIMLPFNEEIENLPDPMVKDPLSEVAKLAGYTDSERWWEHTFEQIQEDKDMFQGLQDLMIEVRFHRNRTESKETLLREAFMRQIIREEMSKNHERIAVICGAWHIPALVEWNQISAKQDKSLLTKLKKIKILSTWIPWTYERLARKSGYGAGVLAPAWYEVLFEHQINAPSIWLVRIAHLFRKEGYDVSPAHLQAILALSEKLAFLRNRPNAGLDELETALESVIHLPKEVLNAKIQSKWIIGEKVGVVPPDIPQTPLQADLYKQIKSARLKNEFESSIKIRKYLDLRVNANRLASNLLHRLNILDIPWGTIIVISDQVKGSFHENWTLKWKPIFMIELMDRGMWGNSIFEAAEKKLEFEIQNVADTLSLVHLLEASIHAGIDNLLDRLSEKLQSFAIDKTDISQFLQSIPILVRIIRYPSHRIIYPDKIFQWLKVLVPAVCSGLPPATYQLADEPAQLLEGFISEAHEAIYLIDGNEFIQLWEESLLAIVFLEEASMRINGLVMRILLEKERIEMETILNKMSFLFSKGNDPFQASIWLEGFLKRGIYLLQHQTEMFDILDKWINDFKEEHFNEILPILRRTFSSFDSNAKQEIWEKITSGTSEKESFQFLFHINDPEIKTFLPLFQQILLD